MVYRDKVLSFMMKRNWDALIIEFKDNEKFNQLFYND